MLRMFPPPGTVVRRAWLQSRLPSSSTPGTG